MSSYKPKRNLIFIHIPKNAGSSMEHRIEIGGNGHQTIAEFQRKLMPAAYKAAFKFAFVRNPWDRVVSAFFHSARVLPRIAGFERLSRDFQPFVKYMGYKGFNIPAMYPEFVPDDQGIPAERTWPIHHHFLPQWFFVTDQQGRIPMDFIGRVENIEDDWKRLCLMTGIGHDPLPRNMMGRRPLSGYRNYYCPETREIVANLFERDIGLFDYEF